MKRALLASVAAALLLAGPAAACSEAEPCVLRVTLEADDLWFDAPGDNATFVPAGWYVLDVFNRDDAAHDLRFQDTALVATGYDDAGPRSRHGPFELAVGGHDLYDDTTGLEGFVRVGPAESGPAPEPTPEPEPRPEPTEGHAPEPEPIPLPDNRKEVPAGAALAVLALAVARAVRRD